MDPFDSPQRSIEHITGVVSANSKNRWETGGVDEPFDIATCTIMRYQNHDHSITTRYGTFQASRPTLWVYIDAKENYAIPVRDIIFQGPQIEILRSCWCI